MNGQFNIEKLMETIEVKNCKVILCGEVINDSKYNVSNTHMRGVLGPGLSFTDEFTINDQGPKMTRSRYISMSEMLVSISNATIDFLHVTSDYSSTNMYVIVIGNDGFVATMNDNDVDGIKNALMKLPKENGHLYIKTITNIAVVDKEYEEFKMEPRVNGVMIPNGYPILSRVCEDHKWRQFIAEPKDISFSISAQYILVDRDEIYKTVINEINEYVNSDKFYGTLSKDSLYSDIITVLNYDPHVVKQACEDSKLMIETFKEACKEFLSKCSFKPLDKSEDDKVPREWLTGEKRYNWSSVNSEEYNNWFSGLTRYVDSSSTVGMVYGYLMSEPASNIINTVVPSLLRRKNNLVINPEATYPSSDSNINGLIGSPQIKISKEDYLETFSETDWCSDLTYYSDDEDESYFVIPSSNPHRIASAIMRMSKISYKLEKDKVMRGLKLMKDQYQRSYDKHNSEDRDISKCTYDNIETFLHNRKSRLAHLSSYLNSYNTLEEVLNTVEGDVIDCVVGINMHTYNGVYGHINKVHIPLTLEYVVFLSLIDSEEDSKELLRCNLSSVDVVSNNIAVTPSFNHIGDKPNPITHYILVKLVEKINKENMNK